MHETTSTILADSEKKEDDSGHEVKVMRWTWATGVAGTAGAAECVRKQRQNVLKKKKEEKKKRQDGDVCIIIRMKKTKQEQQKKEHVS